MKVIQFNFMANMNGTRKAEYYTGHTEIRMDRTHLDG